MILSALIDEILNTQLTKLTQTTKIRKLYIASSPSNFINLPLFKPHHAPFSLLLASPSIFFTNFADMAALTRKYYPWMDFMRYVMAMGIVILHYNGLVGKHVPFVISYDGVPGFFAISGYLIYGSFRPDTTMKQFIKLRARRILPPYFFIVILCAVTLVFCSSLSAIEYFSDSGFWKYLAANLSFLNWLHPSLPGVFEGEQFVSNAVNGSLWTMKVEWMLYLSVPLVVWAIRKFKWNASLTLAVIVILSQAYCLTLGYIYHQTHSEIYKIMSRQVFAQFSFFYMGGLIAIHKDWVVKNLKWIIPASIILYILTLVSQTIRDYTLPLAIASMVLSISLIKTSTGEKRKHSKNISYDMYLFHWPVIQVAVALGIGALPTWQSFGIILLVIILLSILSNRCIERF